MDSTISTATPTTEVWFRNPDLYIRECVEQRVDKLAWDRGYLRKRAIDPNRFADLYFPASIDYRVLVIGEQGSAEVKRGLGLDAPVAVYPTWEYGVGSGDELVELLANPVGNDPSQCDDKRVAPDERPVRGQEHRVVIIRPPIVSSGPGRKFVRYLMDLQEEFPEAIIHVHGIYSYRVLFGCGFRSVDVDSRARAAKGDVELPNGRYMSHERAAAMPQWINLLGFHVSDMKVARNRCMYNIKSALWSAQYFNVRDQFKSRESGPAVAVDPDAVSFTPATTRTVKSTTRVATVGDKFLCDSCSLSDTCKAYRSGGVCSIAGSEPVGLAKFFKTRDSDTIIDGLGTLLAAQTQRLQTGMEDEDLSGELNPEVTKIINSLFTHGVQLAKLVDPKLAAAGAAKMGVQVNVGNIAATTPQAFTAKIVAVLEAQGVPRDKITPEMMMQLMPAPDESKSEAITVASSA